MLGSMHPKGFGSAVLALLIGGALFAGQAQASITLAIDQLTPTVSAGSTFEFTGVITNQSGISLSSTDFFLNFFNYDPSALDPEQILGSTDFTLPNNTYSADTILFSLTLAPGLPAGPQTFGVVLEDANSDLSNEVDITVQIPSTVPEPAAGSLMVAGMLALRWLRRSRQRRTGAVATTAEGECA